MFFTRKLQWIGRLLAIAAILLLAFPAQAMPPVTPQAGWIEVAAIPNPVGFYGWAQCPGEPEVFYVLGGADAVSSPVNYVQKYDVASNSWTSLASLPTALLAPVAVCYQDHIYLAGGSGSSGRTNLFYIYDIAGDSWTSGPSLPRVVVGAAMGAWDGKLYLAGGTPFGSPWGPVRQVNRFDIATNTWSTLTNAQMPVAAGFAGYVQTGRYLYVVGGWSGNFNANVNTTQRLDMAAETWQTGPSFTSRRAVLALPATQNKLYAVGGDVNGTPYTLISDQVEILDLSTWPLGTWTLNVDSLPSSVAANNGSFCSQAATGGEVWSVSGAELDIIQNPVVTDTVQYLPAEPCFQPFYALELQPEVSSGDSFPGQTVTHTLTVDNSGHIADTYTVTLSTSWPATYPSEIGPLAPGETASISVAVQIPIGSADSESDTASLTLTSHGDPMKSDTAVLTTTNAVVLRLFLPVIYQE